MPSAMQPPKGQSSNARTRPLRGRDHPCPRAVAVASACILDAWCFHGKGIARAVLLLRFRCTTPHPSIPLPPPVVPGPPLCPFPSCLLPLQHRAPSLAPPPLRLSPPVLALLPFPVARSPLPFLLPTLPPSLHTPSMPLPTLPPAAPPASSFQPRTPLPRPPHLPPPSTHFLSHQLLPCLLPCLPRQTQCEPPLLPPHPPTPTASSAPAPPAPQSLASNSRHVWHLPRHEAIAHWPVDTIPRGCGSLKAPKILCS